MTEDDKPRYDWWGWAEETDNDNADDRKDVWYLTITDHGEEMAIIVHRTCRDENGVEQYPIDGPLAKEKVEKARRIVRSLNAQAEDLMPAILHHPEAHESWGASFDAMQWWAVTFTLNDGTKVNGHVLGQGSRESDGFVGVRYVPVEGEDWIFPANPEAESKFLACDEFVEVTIH